MSRVSWERDDLAKQIDTLSDMFRMPHVYNSNLYVGLNEKIGMLNGKVDRLLNYLELEDVTIPEKKIVRSRKKLRKSK